ncbi:MAG: xylose isomerase [Puniceicoccaceae bacterium]|nr:MAG: xylose isomerase [Puniceicoccaceae bacterium]
MQTPKQSFSWWCVANKGVDDATLLSTAARIGYTGVELIGEPLWPMAKDHGLAIVAVDGHASIVDGLNRRENAPRILDELRTKLAKAVEWRIPVLICFSGSRGDLSDEAGLANCATTLAEIAPEAEAAGVTLAIELLNSKVDHPDYHCDRTAWGVTLCEQVGSPAVRLLYDIYHMQIMEGDLIRTIRTRHPFFAHYHTAGNPGRGPLDTSQEINYPPIFRAIRETGYTGYIGHEFLPAGDPLAGLEAAFQLTAGS